MEQLWARPGGATVRDVHDALAADRGLAYTTVMTVLDRLAKKGLASRVREGKAWRYAASHSEESLTAQAMRATMEQLDSHGRQAAMLHFLDDSSPGEIADLRAALAELERRKPDPAT